MQASSTLANDTRLGHLDWAALCDSLRARGWATAGPVLDAGECRSLREMFDDRARFRSSVVMARHRFGEGEYRYFDAPLPPLVASLRAGAYRQLAPLANSWAEVLDESARYPPDHEAFLAMCAEAGQHRPTPLLLRYAAGGYNCLHQDLYGAVHFPLQMVVMLSEPEQDYGGGHFVLVETRPRAQSAAEVIRPGLGEAVIFTTRSRPVAGGRGCYRVHVRHGVSTVTHGERHALGVVFHDAA